MQLFSSLARQNYTNALEKAKNIIGALKSQVSIDKQVQAKLMHQEQQSMAEPYLRKKTMHPLEQVLKNP